MKGDYTVVTVSVMVNESNRVSMRFYNLASQIMDLNKTIQNTVTFYGNSTITNVEGVEITYNDENYTEYKILEYAICPDSSLAISPQGLEMLTFPDSSILTLNSQELKIDVDNSQDADLIGDFKLEVLSADLKSNTGETSIVEYELLGFGNLYPFLPKTIDNEYMYSKTTMMAFEDSLFSNGNYRNIKRFKTEVFHKKKGRVDLSDFFSISTYSPKLNRSYGINLPIEFSIQGEEQERNVAERESNFVVLLDNSESMEIQDYVPNRFAAASELANTLLEKNSNSFYLVSGQPIKINENTAVDSLLYHRKYRGTSIGNAIWQAVDDIKDISGKKGIVLITDGDATSGNVTAHTAAMRAKEHGIKLYVVGVGTTGPAPYGTDFFGNTRYIEDTFDDASLKEIAELSGGKYYYLLWLDYKEMAKFIKILILNELK